MKRFICLAILLLNVNSMICPAQQYDGNVIEPIQTWNGADLANERLKAAPPGGYAADEAAWKKLWQAWRASEEAMPTIDFTKSLVAFCTATTPNNCGVRLKLSDAGDLKIETISTLIYSEASTFNYQIVEFSRAKVKTINGKLIMKTEASKFVAQANANGNDQTPSKRAKSLRSARKQNQRNRKN